MKAYISQTSSRPTAVHLKVTKYEARVAGSASSPGLFRH